MMGYILKKLRELYGNKRLLVICAASLVVVLIATAFVLGRSSGNNKSTTATLAAHSGHAATDTPAKNGGKSASSTTTGSKNASATTPKASTNDVVVKTTVNSDGTTTKEIASYVTLPYSTQTQNEVNLKRGTTQVQQAGQNGSEKIVYAVTYDANGKEISRKTLSDTVTAQPVDQITKIGVSDFNLNTDTWDGTGFGETCLQSDFGAAGDGCVGTTSDKSLGDVTLSGSSYIRCIKDASGDCHVDVNVQPVILVHVDNTFSYQGATYVSDIRAGGGVSQLLTPSLCSQYGLACGSW